MIENWNNTKSTPDWFAEELNIFLGDVRKTETEGDCFYLCIYDGEDLINCHVLEQAIIKIEQAMYFLSNNTGFYCYAWIDHQAGQLRISTKSDADIQNNFGSRTEYVKNIEMLIQPLYKEETIKYNPKTWKTKVFVVKNQK